MGAGAKLGAVKPPYDVRLASEGRGVGRLRRDQLIIETLMISFTVIMTQVVLDGIAKRRFSQEHH